MKTKLVIVALILFTAGSAFASFTYSVTVDTSSLKNSNGYLYFQYAPLNDAADSTATVFNFATNGTLTPTNSSEVIDGSAVSGLLPNTLTFGNTSSSATNDYNHGILFGTTISFLLTLSDPAPGGSPSGSSTFSLGLYADEFGTTPLIGGDLFTVSLLNDGTTIVDVSASQASVTAVPIPAAAWLFGSGLFGLIGLKRKRIV